MILFSGFSFVRRINSDSPFAPYAIQILALIIILPVVLTLVLMAKFPSEAATGLIGTIVGFFFGGASHHQQPRNAGGRNQPVKAAGATSRSEKTNAEDDSQS